MKASIRTVPISNMLLPATLEARPLASEVRRLILLRRLPMPGDRDGGCMAGKCSSEEPAVVPLCEDGIVPALEKLRRAWRAGRGAVLLRLRLWVEKRGTCGASAAKSMLPPGTSGTGAGAPALLKERLPFGMGRGRPLATRMESRMGFRRREV